MKSSTIIFVILCFMFRLSFSQSNHLTKNTAQSKAEKRYVHPKAKYISISSGWGFSSVNLKGANNFLQQGVSMRRSSFIPELRYEHGIKNNIFAEIGYLSFVHGFTLSRIVNEMMNTSYERLYRNNEFNFGLGYRLFGKNNYHILNFHSGLFFGFTNRELSAIPDYFSRSMHDMETNEIFNINISVLNKNQFSFGPYVGISKELRLSRDVRLFLKYTHRFGLIKSFNATFDLSSETISVPQEQGTIKMNSGGSVITAGIKIEILRKLN